MTAAPPATIATPDAGQAAAFLRMLYGDTPGYIALNYAQPVPVGAHKPSLYTEWFSTDAPDEVAARAVRLCTSRHVWIGAGLQASPQSSGKRGSSDDVIAIPGLWADIDFAHLVHKKAEQLPPDLDAAIGLVRTYRIGPTYIVHTGHGIQPWWLFDKPMMLDTAEARQLASGLLNRLKAQFQAAAADHNWKVDAVADFARLMRLPGLINIKAEPLPVRIIEEAEYLRYDAASHDDALDSLPIAGKQESPKTSQPSPTDASDATLIEKAKAAKNGAEFSRLWNGDDGLHGGDTSAADQAFCNHLAFWAGPDAGRIDSLFRQSGRMREKWDQKHYADGRTYGAGTIGKALAGRTEFYDWHRHNGNGHHETAPNFDEKETAGRRESAEAAPDEAKPRFVFHTADEFDALDLRRVYHVPGILAAGSVPTIISGSFKTLKTSIMMDLAISVATGAMFLGQFPSNQCAVAIMSGESGGFALQNLQRRVVRSKGWTVDAVGSHLRICTDVPDAGSRKDLAEIRGIIETNQIGLMFLDPAYLMMRGMRSDDAGNLFAMAEFLEPLAKMAEQTGCTVCIIHHNSRGATRANAGEPAELADVAWSGFAEWAGQWLLLSRRERFNPDSNGEHRLWLSAGGRDGHSNLVGVNVTEGRADDPGGLRWDVEVERASAVRSEAVTAEQTQRDLCRKVKLDNQAMLDRKAILDVVSKMKSPETKRVIRDRTGINANRYALAFAALLDESLIVPQDIKKNGRVYEGYTIAPVASPTPATSDSLGEDGLLDLAPATDRLSDDQLRELVCKLGKLYGLVLVERADEIKQAMATVSYAVADKAIDDLYREDSTDLNIDRLLRWLGVTE